MAKKKAQTRMAAEFTGLPILCMIRISTLLDLGLDVVRSYGVRLVQPPLMAVGGLR